MHYKEVSDWYEWSHCGAHKVYSLYICLPSYTYISTFRRDNISLLTVPSSLRHILAAAAALVLLLSHLWYCCSLKVIHRYKVANRDRQRFIMDKFGEGQQKIRASFEKVSFNILLKRFVWWRDCRISFYVFLCRFFGRLTIPCSYLLIRGFSSFLGIF